MKNRIHTLTLAYRLALIFLLTSHDNLYATEQLAQQHCLTVLNYRKSKKIAEDSDLLRRLLLLIQSTDQVTKGKRGTVCQQLGFEPNNKDIDFILSVRWAYAKGCQQRGSSQSVKEPTDAQTHLMTVITYATKNKKEALLSRKDKLESTVLQIIQADEITTGKGGGLYQELGFMPSKTKDIPFLSALQWAYRKGAKISLDLDDTQQSSSDEQKELFKEHSNRPFNQSVSDMSRSLNRKNSQSITRTIKPKKAHYRRASRQSSTSKRAKPSSESSNEEAATSPSQARDWLPLFLVIGSVLALITKIGHSLYHTYINGQRPVGRIKMQKKLRTE